LQNTEPRPLRKPTFQWSDIWRSPFHDLPIRDELIYQYLPLAPGMRVLEIGPGSGFTAFRLARQVPTLTLLDVASANIQRLRHTLKGIESLRVFRADACAPRLGDQLGTRFEAVYGLEVFACIPDPRACLANLAAVLEPGGHLLLQWPNYETGRSAGPITCSYMREDLDRWLSEAGFASWALYALSLRPYANVLFRNLHERPLQLLRNLRPRTHTVSYSYDDTWAFNKSDSPRYYTFVVNSAWLLIFALMRLGGECFQRTELSGDIQNRNLLLVARR